MDIPQRISPETLYPAIYAMPTGELRQEVIGMLSKQRKGRRPTAAFSTSDATGRRRGRRCTLYV